jgi:hypothetical protein
LDSRPIVITTVHNDLYDTIAFCQVSGANPTGFWALFSTLTDNTGYYLDIYCSNSTETGMAANVIVNNTTNNINSSTFYGVSGVTGISVTGSTSITGLVNIVGAYGTNIILSGTNTIAISGGGGSSTSGPQLYVGSGSPEGIQSAISGSIWSDWFNKTLYQKFTGTAAYGWE